MSLLNDILQQNNQIAQNPTSVIRTPTQVAYDNLLNRQAEIEKQNKTNGLVGGLMSGIGGLGKIIASAVVKNPFQQAGAMEGLTQQEGRIDQLRQAYENARQTKNRDYIQQAKEQLGMAQADEDKAYNRELTANQIAYKKAQDELAQKNYEKEQEIKAQQRAEDVAFRNQQAAAQARQQEIANKHWEIQDAYARDKAEQDRIQRQFDNDLSLMDRNIKEQEAIKKAKEEEDKVLQEEYKKNQERTFTLLNNGSIRPETAMVVNNNPELYKYLKDDTSWRSTLPVVGSKKKLELDYKAILKDKGIEKPTKAQIEALKIELGL